MIDSFHSSTWKWGLLNWCMACARHFLLHGSLGLKKELSRWYDLMFDASEVTWRLAWGHWCFSWPRSGSQLEHGVLALCFNAAACSLCRGRRDMYCGGGNLKRCPMKGRAKAKNSQKGQKRLPPSVGCLHCAESYCPWKFFELNKSWNFQSKASSYYVAVFLS